MWYGSSDLRQNLLKYQYKSFALYTWFVLAINLLVILWGAYVRATGSGAGCGSHWPLCNGEIVPRSAQLETLIEFAHRLSSGLALVFIVILFVWGLRISPKGNPVRVGVSFCLLFIITEALIGAGLVLFEWVAFNESIGRAIAMSVHLLNTFLLLAAIVITGWLASGGSAPRIKGQGVLVFIIALGCAGLLLLGVSGALTALGDTLFPSDSLQEGISQDFSPTAHFLIRLRLFHPLIAILVGIYLTLMTGFLNIQRPDPIIRRVSMILLPLFALQGIAGLLNVYLLAPVWMQIVHLLLADMTWIVLVLLCASGLSQRRSSSQSILSSTNYQGNRSSTLDQM